MGAVFYAWKALLLVCRKYLPELGKLFDVGEMSGNSSKRKSLLGVAKPCDGKTLYGDKASKNSSKAISLPTSSPKTNILLKLGEVDETSEKTPNLSENSQGSKAV